jgi:GWxTD domain-containing protein
MAVTTIQVVRLFIAVISPAPSALLERAVYLRTVRSEGSNRGLGTALRAAVLALLASAAALPALGWEAPRRLEDWHEGPVRYLMSRKEVRLFQRADDDAERVAFIRRFWQRRDPDPRTPENEMRLVFWARVTEAGRRFSDSVYPGWKTDRGKIFILLGPPDDVERDLYYDTGVDSGNRGLLRWHYEGGARSRLPQTVSVVAFVRELGGGWKLTDDPRLSSVFFDIHSPTYSDQYFDLSGLTGTVERLMHGVPWQDATIDVAMDLGRLQEVPTEHELLEAVVDAEEFLGTLAGSWQASPLVTHGGEPTTAITLAVRRDQLEPAWEGSAAALGTRFLVSAELTLAEAGEPAKTLEIPEQAFLAEPAPAEGDPWLRFQAVRPVPEGRWQLSGVVLDRLGGGSAVVRGTLDVPRLPDEAPRLTGPVLARALREAQGPSATGRREPFRLWDQLVIPRMGDEIATDEPFALYVEAHSPPDLPGTPVRLAWRIEHAEPGSETFTLLAKEGSVEDGRGPRAWSYPPGRLPPGRYRLTFTATDTRERSTRRELAFSVVPAAERDR